MQSVSKPDVRDEPYGRHERNKLDLWLAECEELTPLLIFIHGGGFRLGDKSDYDAGLLKACFEAGISCASLNYRLSQMAKYPAQMHDCARGLQYIRLNANRWNIDPARVAATGPSAGAGISLWLAFHDDMADPDADDPVARQSTRISCAIATNAQSTYDPRVIREIIPGNAYQESALIQLFGLPADWDWDKNEVDAEVDALTKDSSPINHLSAGDPPVFIYHYEQQNIPGNIHHSNFGRYLEKAMDTLGIECVRRMDTDYESPEQAREEMLTFLKRQFRM
ncbi:MAG: alpha/beta hydrolase [Candidatus Brocadiae bacterium]|nr:alpha/beta hydrolase [Candidatus Brocadiia bacterium]